MARKIYSAMPTKENLKFLDIDLCIIGYNCGLFEFDWDLLKMVRNYNYLAYH